VAPQASSLHNQPFFESSIADPHGARRWVRVLSRTREIVSGTAMARPDGEPKLPGAVSGGPLAYSMRRFQGKGSQERVGPESFSGANSGPFTASPRALCPEPSARLVWHQIARRRSGRPGDRDVSKRFSIQIFV
jgi:hypothetical protein